MAVKKAMKSRLKFDKKGELNAIKGDFKSMKPKVPKADMSAQEEAMEQTRLQKAELDEEENRRRKRLFAAASGARGFKGSAMFRSRAGNTASSASPSASASSATAAPSRSAGISAYGPGLVR